MKGGIKKVKTAMNTTKQSTKGGIPKTNKVMNTAKYKKGGKMKKGC